MFYLKMALRYLRGKNKFFFRSANSLSLWGIIIGVFAILVVSSVMNGFDSDMRRRVIGSKAEIRIYDSKFNPISDYRKLTEKLDQLGYVKKSTPVCEMELLLQNRKNITSTLCYGIDLDSHRKVTDILKNIRVGNPTSSDLQNDGIIIGLDTSITLNATVGEYVNLSAPIGTEPTPFGLLPRTKKLKVIGLFISGLPEYDKLYSYISLSNAQYFLGLNDEVTGIELKTLQAETSHLKADKIGKILGKDYIVEDWSEFESNLFNSIKMEKIVMFLVLGLMILITSMNMTGNFIKLVAEKKTELGILKAIGTADRKVIRIFITAGLIIGIIGAFWGTITALLLVTAQHQWRFIKIPVPGFPLHWLPVEIRITDFILAPLFAVIISFFTTLHPAKKTAAIDPIKIIRN